MKPPVLLFVVVHCVEDEHRWWPLQLRPGVQLLSLSE
jgi:hypothetical protein